MGFSPDGLNESEGIAMFERTTSSNERYLKEQINIMNGLLDQMVDRYAIARIRIQLWHLQSELDGSGNPKVIPKT